jgi:GTPase subunit of restriction endonuclease
MKIDKQKIPELVSLVRRYFPDWNGFSDQRFVENEIEYKQAIIADAQDILSKSKLQRLIDEGDFDEFVARLDKIGKHPKNNLLYRSVPSTGDLSILYQPELDEPSFCRAVFDLLCGAGSSHERFDRYMKYVMDNGLPHKWTFPTYFLFICHPETEIFVKPTITKWFIGFMGLDDEIKWTSVPTGTTYAAIKDLCQQLKNDLQEYGPWDMVDIQSLIYVTFGAANPKKYTLTQCAEDTGFDIDMLEGWIRAIERKGQAILYGPPGTGKTYVAEHLARHLIGGGDGFIELVQFHPAYAYEDFIQGIRPLEDDGELRYPMIPGRFLQFCRRAESCQGTCVLIIDEINRANLARVFGELMYLLEYRDREIHLAGGGNLRIPGNVRIIGTMNTADRSIALVDHALRRRFAFLKLQPNYDVLHWYHRSTGFSTKSLVGVLRRLNNQINDPHYEVGISFFLNEDLDEEIEDIWKMEIEPYLEEYFFDQPETVEDFRWGKVRSDIFS